MNILFTTITMRGGGTERVVALLANCMVRNGHKVAIMTIVDGKIEYELDERINIIDISSKNAGGKLKIFKRFKLIRDEIKGLDSINILALGTVASIYTVVANLFFKNKVLVSERNDPNIFNGHIIKAYERFIRNLVYIFSKKIILQTHKTKECFPRILHKKIEVISNPIPTDMPKPRSCEEREKTIISVGRLIPSKNHRLLVEVFKNIVEKYPEYQLIILGEGTERKKLEELVSNMGLENKVFIKGFCDNVYEELGKNGIYVSTSLSEGLSNSLLEALAMGIPVIASECPVGGERESIEDGINGYIIEPNNSKQLFERLDTLISDRELYNSMCEQYHTARLKYDEKRIMEEWLGALL